MRENILVKAAWQHLTLHKRRTLLSLLGILFGILALVAVGNVSLAMKRRVEIELNKFGPNLVIVRAGVVYVHGRSQRQFSFAKTLKMGDVKAIRHSILGIDIAIPLSEKEFSIRYKQNKTTARLIGAGPKIFELRNLGLLKGKFYSEGDERLAQRNVVLGYKVWETLFSGGDAIGKTILIRRVPCKVIGILEKKGVDLAGEDQDSVIYTPLSTMMRRFLNVDYFSTILIKAKEKKNIANIKEETERLLRKRHKIGPGGKDDFTVYTLSEMTKKKEEGLKLVSLLSKMAATISFSIGGLGIFAMMLLSVSERKREIGIRRAVGAKKGDILIQFLGESLFISLFGGIGGVVLGIIISLIIIIISGLPLVINPIHLALAFFISISLGVLSGLYPAYLATSIEPIEVLKA